MKKLLIATVSALTLSGAMLATGAAFAQVAQLSEEVAAKLEMLGIGMPIALTDDQLLQIESVLNGSDDEATKKMAIETIVAE
jgi:hypothetical protein